MVGTTDRSMAAMCGAWMRRIVLAQPERRAPPPAMYLATVV